MNCSTVVAVLGASGGVGTSALAAAVAVRGARAGLHVCCADLDVLGGGLDVCFGIELEPGLRWADLAALAGSSDGAALRARLPVAEGVSVLSFGRGDERLPGADVVSEVLRALAGDSELLVLDVPRDGPLTAVALQRCTLAVVLAGSTVGQLSALAAVSRRVASAVDEVFVCLRGARESGELQGLVADSVDLPVVGWLGEDSRIGADLLHGIAPGTRSRGPMVELADRILVRAVPRVRTGAA